MKTKLLLRFALLLPVILNTPLMAATYTVTTTNDTGPNSLRAVITTANGVAGPHTIDFANTGHFAGGGTINLVTPLPVFSNSVTIAGWLNGGGSNAVSVNGSAFVFQPGTSNAIQNLNIGGSVTNGQNLAFTGCIITNGGIYSTGLLFCANSSIYNGGIYSSGVLQISSSSVVGSPTAGIWSSGNATLNNVTVSMCSGGGIYNEGVMAIASSQIFNNISPTNGAGIYSTDSIQITGCQIIGNTANGFGGGIFNSGAATVAQSTVQSNVTLFCFGGGIYNSGLLSVNACLFSRNGANGQSALTNGNGGGAGGFGGAIFVAGTSISLSNTTFFENTANGGAGGNGSDGGTGAGLYGGLPATCGNPTLNGGDGGFASGGGGASCGGGGKGGFGGGGGGGSGGMSSGGIGGIWGGNGMSRSGNASGLLGGGGAGLGSAIFVQTGSMSVVNCTIAQNKSGGGLTGGHGAAALYNYGGSVILLNTIIATNSSTTNDPPDAYGTFVSHGYNFIGNSSGSTGWDAVLDYQNATPILLGPLQDNGGPTLTCALLPGSLCILSGTSVGAPLTDQRGVIRPLNKCDIGAYQFTTLLVPAITWTNPTPIIYGTALSSNQLNASANIGGSFAYSPAIGTILPAGSNQVLTAVFTPGDPNTATGATNTVLLTVLKANQTINFQTIPPQTVNAPPIVLNATASSGLPVSYSLIAGDALLAGNLLSVGPTPSLVTVRALQAGNTNYNAAPSVDQSFLVVTNSMPLITADPTNVTVNLGDDAQFTVSATTAPLNYQWRFNGLDLPGATNATLFLPRTTTNNAGPYRVVAGNPLGSVTSVVAVLSILAPAGVPQITSPPASRVVRAGETASFTVTATGNPTLLYQWYQGASPNTNGLIPAATGTGYTTPALTTNTSYWVSVRNTLGLVDSLPAMVTVLPSQTPKLSAQFVVGFPVVTLDGAVGTNYVIQYKNSFSDSNWTLLLNFTLPVNPFQYFDTTAAGQPRRFYRAYAY